jgi:hypothetical protein
MMMTVLRARQQARLGLIMKKKRVYFRVHAVVDAAGCSLPPPAAAAATNNTQQ